MVLSLGSGFQIIRLLGRGSWLVADLFASHAIVLVRGLDIDCVVVLWLGEAGWKWVG